MRGSYRVELTRKCLQRVTNVFAHKACGRQLIHHEAMVKASFPMAMPANVKHPFQATVL